MKSEFQVLKFLNKYNPKSSLDRDVIDGFLGKQYKITPCTKVFADKAENELIDVQSFLHWFEEGLGETDIAAHDDKIVMLGECSTEKAYVVASKTGSENIKKEFYTISQNDLLKVDEKTTKEFKILLLKNNFQYDYERCEIVRKYIPRNNEKIVFHKPDWSVSGAGVIRNINPESYEIELYCYFTYPTKTNPQRLGYSMHEEGIVNLYEYDFEPISDKNTEFGLNGYSTFRRLNRELAKVGKVWKDKLHRIEPLEGQVPVGKPYWYISDKMKVVQDVEKGTPTSHFRFLAGNYFVNYESALIILSDWKESLINYMASDGWPIIPAR